MTLRSSDLQSDSDLDSIRNSCDVSFCHVVGADHGWERGGQHLQEVERLIEVGLELEIARDSLKCK